MRFLQNIVARLRQPNILSKIDARYGIGRIERLLYSNWFNPVATLWINFRCLPLKQAIKLPLWIYGRPRFYSLSGKINIKGKVSRGIIKFNMTKPGAPGHGITQSELYLLGTIEFHGKCEIGSCNKIIVAHNAILELYNNAMVMDQCCVAVHEEVTIGENTILAHNVQVMDSNFHFIADLNTKSVYKRTGQIRIGNGCWICNSSTIMMNTIIPNYAIVGSHSLVKGDFSMYKTGCLIAGNPAKLIKENRVRIFNSKVEKQIWEEFRNSSDNRCALPTLDIDELVKYQ